MIESPKSYRSHSNAPDDAVSRLRVRGAWIALLSVAVLGTAGCQSNPAADSTSGETNAAVAGTTVAEGTVTAEQVAEVNRQVELFLSPGDRYDRLITAVIIDVDGKPVVGHYGANGGPDVTGNVYSVTKSVMSALIGIAIDEGSIPGVDATLGELLPRYRNVMLPEVAAVTLEQILTMTGGIVGDDSDDRWPDSDDWISTIVSTPLEQPAGTAWSYASFGSHVVSAVLAQATGRIVLDYASGA